MKKSDDAGKCRSCGVDLVDWERVHEHVIEDIDYTFEALKYELIRHHFWHVEIDQKAINYAKRKGLRGMASAVRSRIRSSVGSGNNPFDGRQTPMEGSGNPIHYAQHATASCCRKCIEYWHGIPVKSNLNDQQIDYLTDLVMRYIRDRMPDLQYEGVHVPPIRKKKKK